MTKAEKEGILSQLTSLADFAKDSNEYEGLDRKDIRLSVTKEVYDELTKECGHEVDMVGGIRLQLTEDDTE